MELLTKKTVYIKPSTGEVMYDFTEENVKPVFPKKSDKEYWIYRECGNFVWCIYPLKKEFFSNVKGGYIAKIMLIATYVRDNGCLMDCHRNALTYTQIKDITKLSPSKFSEFWNYLLDNKIVSHKENGFYINDSFFMRGSISNRKVGSLLDDQVYITRIFIHKMREMYQNCKPRMHSTLSYLFKLIPYMNRKYNIVCHNPLEENLSKIKPLTPDEICDVIGYSRLNFSRLIKTLSEIRISVRHLTQPIIKYVDEIKGAVVNPYLIYSGYSWNEIEELAKF